MQTINNVTNTWPIRNGPGYLQGHVDYLATPYKTHNTVTYKAVSNDDMRRLCSATEFALIVIGWAIARIFRCGIGKLTYAQLCAKYNPFRYRKTITS